MSDVQWLCTSEGRVVAEVGGSGPPLLCLHGVSANRSSWHAVSRRLRSRFTVIAPDLLGRGESDIPPTRSYRLHDEVRRARDLMSASRIEDAIVVGHSHGAAIALGLAKSHPGVAGLVLVNPVTPWSRRPFVLCLPALRHSRVAAAALSRFRKPLTRYILERRVLGSGDGANPQLIERYASPYATSRRARELLAIVADWHPQELENWLPETRVPAVLVIGSRDRRMGMRETTRLADRLGASCVIAAGGGHALPEERPALVCDAITELAGGLAVSA